MDDQTYRLAKAIAAQKKISLGKVVAEAISSCYGGGPALATPKFGRSKAGFPTLDIGRTITPEEVAEMLDE